MNYLKTEMRKTVEKRNSQHLEEPQRMKFNTIKFKTKRKVENSKENKKNHSVKRRMKLRESAQK